MLERPAIKRLLAGLPIGLAALDANANPLSGGGPTSLEGFALWTPDFLAPLLATLASLQRQAMATLRDQVDAIQTGQGVEPVFALVAIAFLYGIVHAAGPGHGKFVVGGFFLSRRAKIAQGIGLSAAISFIQALSAVLLVAVFTVAVDAGSRRLLENANLLETLSYGLIALLGVGLAWNAFKKKSCCHAPHEHGPTCSHAQQHRQKTTFKELLASSLAVGIRPCTGAVMILLFTFANQIAWAGVMATFAMALGSMITVSAVSLGAIGAHSALSRLAGSTKAWELARQAGGVAAGLLIALAGAAMMAASLTPTAINF